MKTNKDKKIIIIGAGGHGKVAADIALELGYQDIAFLDDDTNKQECLGFPVKGIISDLEKYEQNDFFVAIGNNRLRKKISERLFELDYNLVSLIHPKAIIADKVRIGKGTIIMPGAIINVDSIIGKGCIINTASTIDHDNVLGKYVHVSAGCHLAGEVIVKDHTFIGIGSIVSNSLTIEHDVTIGAGSTVLDNIPANCTAVGTPCKPIKYNQK